MAHRFENLRILLVQIRESDEVAEHERSCLRDVTGLRADQIDPANVVTHPKIERERYDRADAVIIGGAAIHSAVDTDPFTGPLIDDIRGLVDRGKPLFGSCWGHQFIARALGGTVIHDNDRSEVGAHNVRTTPAAADDPIFSHCPDEFTALMGHYDRVSELPPGAVELATSPVCRNQAFRIGDLPVYGTQFHTELTPDRLIERLSVYRSYAPSEDEFEEIKRSLKPTPVAQRIMHNFLESIAQA